MDYDESLETKTKTTKTRSTFLFAKVEGKVKNLTRCKFILSLSFVLCCPWDFGKKRILLELFSGNSQGVNNKTSEKGTKRR